jgi:hypothetical protein
LTRREITGGVCVQHHRPFPQRIQNYGVFINNEREELLKRHGAPVRKAQSTPFGTARGSRNT